MFEIYVVFIFMKCVIRSSDNEQFYNASKKYSDVFHAHVSDFWFTSIIIHCQSFKLGLDQLKDLTFQI